MFLIVLLCTVFLWLPWVLSYTCFIASSKACLPYFRLGFFAVPTCKYCVEYRMMLSLCGNHQAWLGKFVRRTGYCIYLRHGSCCSFSPFLLPNFPFCSVPSDGRASSSHSLSPDPLAINPTFPRFPHLKVPLLSLYSWRIFCLFVSCQIQNSWWMAPVVVRLENAAPFPVASMVCTGNLQPLDLPFCR